MVKTPPLIIELRRRRWLGRTTLKRGERPQRPDVRFKANYGCITMIVVAVLVYIACIAIAKAVEIIVGLAVVCGLMALARSFREWIMPAIRGDAFNDTTLSALSPSVLFLMGAAPGSVISYNLWPQPGPVIIGTIAAGIAFRPLTRAINGKRLPPLNTVLRTKKDIDHNTGPDMSTPGPFGLWIGEATGILANDGHSAGMQSGSNVTLNFQDAAKNIAVFGETGTGKTTRVMTHILVQALDFDAGALIFDVRGDFHETASRAAVLTGKTVQRIGIGHLGVNLLEGLTPNTAAGFLEAAFRLLGQGEGDSGFWVSLAVARCQNALGILNHTPEMYSLQGLYRYIFEKPLREAIISKAQETLADLQLRGTDGDTEAALEARRLKTALDYECTVVPGYGEREQSGLNRTIETALVRFADPELEDAFCSASGEKANLEDLLDGAIFVVNLPREQFKAAARVVYLLLKERFFQLLNTRAQMQAGPRKERPVLFFCDEYQQIASAGDASFFDTSRALGVVAIVAAQSLDAYLNALGNEHATMTLLGNFANIIAFRSTPKTMEYLTA